MLLTAFPVGFFAGLFGIGGGLITVPFLFFIFEALNIDKTYVMCNLAVGTSFSIIIPTSIVSVLTQKTQFCGPQHNKNLWIICSYKEFFWNYFCNTNENKVVSFIFFHSCFFLRYLFIIKHT